jgi:hypothetical protein
MNAVGKFLETKTVEKEVKIKTIGIIEEQTKRMAQGKTVAGN